MRKVIIKKKKSEVYVFKKIIRIVAMLAFVGLMGFGAYYFLIGAQAYAIKLFIAAAVIFVAGMLLKRAM